MAPKRKRVEDVDESGTNSEVAGSVQSSGASSKKDSSFEDECDRFMAQGVAWQSRIKELEAQLQTKESELLKTKAELAQSKKQEEFDVVEFNRIARMHEGQMCRVGTLMPIAKAARDLGETSSLESAVASALEVKEAY